MIVEDIEYTYRKEFKSRELHAGSIIIIALLLTCLLVNTPKAQFIALLNNDNLAITFSIIDTLFCLIICLAVDKIVNNYAKNFTAWLYKQKLITSDMDIVPYSNKLSNTIYTKGLVALFAYLLATAAKFLLVSYNFNNFYFLLIAFLLFLFTTLFISKAVYDICLLVEIIIETYKLKRREG